MSEDGNVDIWWDRNIKEKLKREHNRPVFTVVIEQAHEWKFVNFSVPWDRKVVSKEDEKITKCPPLANEIRKMDRVSKKILSLVVGWFVVGVSDGFEGYKKFLGFLMC